MCKAMCNAMNVIAMRKAWKGNIKPNLDKSN